jgi:hypothetical protein
VIIFERLRLSLFLLARCTFSSGLFLLLFHLPPPVRKEAWIATQHRRKHGWVERPVRRPQRKFATVSSAAGTRVLSIAMPEATSFSCIHSRGVLPTLKRYPATLLARLVTLELEGRHRS